MTLAHPHGITDRRIAKLERQVRKLRRQVAQLRYFESCRTEVVAIDQFPGYLNDPDQTGPAPVEFQTALDFTTSTTPDLFVERFAPSCVSTARAARTSPDGLRHYKPRAG